MLPHSPRVQGRRHEMAREQPGARGRSGPGMRRGQNDKAEAWAVLRVNTVVVEELKWHSGNRPAPPDRVGRERYAARASMFPVGLLVDGAVADTVRGAVRSPRAAAV